MGLGIGENVSVAAKRAQNAVVITSHRPINTTHSSALLPNQSQIECTVTIVPGVDSPIIDPNELYATVTANLTSASSDLSSTGFVSIFHDAANNTVIWSLCTHCSALSFGTLQHSITSAAEPAFSPPSLVSLVSEHLTAVPTHSQQFLEVSAQGHFHYRGSLTNFLLRIVQSEVRVYGSVLLNIAANVSVGGISADRTEVALSAIGQY